jgi:hypothetical protein
MRARAVSLSSNESHEGPSSTAIVANPCATERERTIGSTKSGSSLALKGRRPRSIATSLTSTALPLPRACEQRSQEQGVMKRTA